MAAKTKAEHLADYHTEYFGNLRYYENAVNAGNTKNAAIFLQRKNAASENAQELDAIINTPKYVTGGYDVVGSIGPIYYVRIFSNFE